MGLMRPKLGFLITGTTDYAYLAKLVAVPELQKNQTIQMGYRPAYKGITLSTLLRRDAE